MGGYVFISYSRSDRGYVTSLAAHLQSAGIPVWNDYELASGDRWESVISERIDACAAVVVVMSPAANKSVWVKREINHAEGRRKPLFPLLLQGEIFFRLNDLQFDDVTARKMPTDRVLDRIRHLLIPSSIAGTSTAIQQPMEIDLRTILISPSCVAHVPNCPHKEDQDFSRWGTIRDTPDAWNGIGKGEAITANSGSNPRLVAKKRCRDCVRRMRHAS